MKLESRIKRLEKAFLLTLGSPLLQAPRVGGLPRHIAIKQHILWLRTVAADPRFFELREQIQKQIAECEMAYRAERASQIRRSIEPE